MGASNFDAKTLSGENERYRAHVGELKERYGFDFATLGLAAFPGAPLKWLYSAGDTSNRHRRIVLAPGHGVGGIVLKTGKPMVFSDIDRELDPREYSSYPIVFAEDLRSLCALPVTKEGRIVGVLLCAFRIEHDDHLRTFHELARNLGGSFCDLGVITDDFLDFAWANDIEGEGEAGRMVVRSDLSRTIAAQEDERRRISRELHDGVAQELLTTSFKLRQLADTVDDEGCRLLDEALGSIDSVLDELHNISVMLRPSSGISRGPSLAGNRSRENLRLRGVNRGQPLARALRPRDGNAGVPHLPGSDDERKQIFRRRRGCRAGGGSRRLDSRKRIRLRVRVQR